MELLFQGRQLSTLPACCSGAASLLRCPIGVPADPHADDMNTVLMQQQGKILCIDV